MDKIKPIYKLQGYKFIIPRYQRGYRWDYDQIEMLLNDLLEFSRKNNKQRNECQSFYCLQPVVVVPKGKDENGNPQFEVVDGQQRLTTLYLLSYYLDKENFPYFFLEFEGRNTQQSYIESKDFAKVNDKSFMDNIDNFYLHKAYQTIEKWFKSHFTNETTGKMDTRGVRKFNDLLWSEEAVVNDKLPYVAIIWYKISEKDALTSFRNLNYGKIPLTPTEIVKALLLQKDCYDDNSPERNFAERRAAEWETLSLEMAHPHLKGMLGDEDIRLLDVAVEAVADELNYNNNYNFKRKSSNQYTKDWFDYYVINKYLNEAENRSEATRKVWDLIRDKGNRIKNWYDHREWYHLIGLYSLVTGKKSKDLIKEIEGIERGKDKKAFALALKKKIGESISVPRALDKDKKPLPDNKQGLSSPELRYGEKQEKKIRPILMAFNVYIVDKETDGETRFPFHLFRHFNPTSLEHIHPQSVDHTDYGDVKKWFEIKKDFLSNDERIGMENYLQKESTFRENIEDVKKIIIKRNKELERELNSVVRDKSEIITSTQLHSIENLTLIDKDTNSALQFSPMDIKRSVLIDREKKGLTFIPPATHRIFSKFYSADNPDSMKFWLKPDRDKYFIQLEKVYNYFTEK